MVDFAKLRNKRPNVDALAAKAESMKGGFKKDERIWKPERDSNGNFEGVVRFLDISPADMEIMENIAAKEGEDVAFQKVTPWVLMYEHAFKGPGGWYIEKSRTTLNNDEPDPLAELNKAEWNDNDEAAKKRVSARSRRKKYYSNVLIIKDGTKPENDGKVMLFEYGQRIFDKINGVLKPQFESDPKFNPFDFYEGANFILKVFTEQKGKNKFPNYDKSEFSTQQALFGGDDAKIEELWKKTYSLQDLITPDKFKSYDQLKKRLESVMKMTASSSVGVMSEETPAASSGMQSAPETSLDAIPESNDSPASEPKSTETSLEEDDMDFFDNL